MSGVYTDYRGAEADMSTFHKGLKNFVGDFEPKAIRANQLSSERTNGFFTESVWPRLKAVGLLISAPVAQIVDTGIGAVLGGLSIITVGYFPKLNKRADTLIESGNNLLSEGFASFVRVINPAAKSLVNHTHRSEAYHFTDYAVSVFKKSEAWANCENDGLSGAFWRQFASRVGFVTSGALFAVTRSVDTFVGLIYALGAIVQVGTAPNWNHGAYKNLKLTAVLGDLVICVRKAVNPWSQPADPDYASSPSQGFPADTFRDEESQGSGSFSTGRYTSGAPASSTSALRTF